MNACDFFPLRQQQQQGEHAMLHTTHGTHSVSGSATATTPPPSSAHAPAGQGRARGGAWLVPSAFPRAFEGRAEVRVCPSHPSPCPAPCRAIAASAAASGSIPKLPAADITAAH